MKWYPIKKEFVSIFEGKEEVLETLIQRQSKQLDAICETIDEEDFYQHCIRFYNEDDYKKENHMIVYTHPITKESSYCILGKYTLTLSSLLGFEAFLYRYYSNYYGLFDSTCCGCWISFEKAYK